MKGGQEQKMKELIDILGNLGINYYGDETRILIWVTVKYVNLDSIPTMILIQDDAEIKIEDLLIAKRITITKAVYRKEILLGKNARVWLEGSYLFIDSPQEFREGKGERALL